MLNEKLSSCYDQEKSFKKPSLVQHEARKDGLSNSKDLLDASTEKHSELEGRDEEAKSISERGGVNYLSIDDLMEEKQIKDVSS